MRAVMALARREFGALLWTPAGCIIAALFLFLNALIFFVIAPNLFGTGFRQGQPASMRLFFETSAWVMLLIAPAVSMRAISDELRTGTIETLLSAPVSETAIMLGKFLGSMAVIAALLLPTVLIPLAIEMHGRPDHGEMLLGYLGLLLLGSACVASGLFFSSLTSSQVLAFLSTVFFWMLLLLASLGLPAAARALSDIGTAGPGGAGGGDRWTSSLAAGMEQAAALAGAINPVTHLRSFVLGLFDSYAVAVFAALTVFFLILSVRALKWRRWT